MPAGTVTIGSGIATGSSFFATMGSAFAALPVLATAAATAGVIIVCIRYVASPSPENLENAKAQIVRILVISAFLAMLGGIIGWVCSGMGGTPAGLSSLVSGI